MTVQDESATITITLDVQNGQWCALWYECAGKCGLWSRPESLRLLQPVIQDVLSHLRAVPPDGDAVPGVPKRFYIEEPPL